MPTFVRAAALALCAGALAAPPLHGQQPETGALVTVLGNDTIAVEQWTRTGGRIDAEAVVRSPRTVLRRFTLELSPSGALRSWEDATLDAENPGARPLRTETIQRAGDGWRRTVVTGDSIASTALAALDSLTLPWVDLVHWPFDLATRRVVARGGSEQPFVTGGRPLRYGVARDGERVTLTHPLRGPSVARVDAQGRLLSLDAAGTTRKVVVTRVASVDVRGAALRWAAADRAGRGIGELSGRGADTADVAGARITLDYGTPSVRGRRIWGGVVPWGQLWRTGANRATHLRTSRPLVLGTGADSLAVPAGEYTLFSIPAEGGGVLIVNRQTGQAGTSYDAAQDLGRVPLTRRTLAEPVERFTIRVTPEGAAGGLLRIQWADAEMVVPFRVPPPATATATAGASQPGAPRPRPNTNRNLITAEDIAAHPARDLYALVRSIRPAWLRGTAATTTAYRSGNENIPDVHTRMVVMHDGLRLGEIEELRRIPIETVGEVRYLDSREAVARYGGGFGGGAIVVTSR